MIGAWMGADVYAGSKKMSSVAFASLAGQFK